MQQSEKQTVLAYRHSQEVDGKCAQKEEVEILGQSTENGVTTYVVRTRDGIQCTAIFNIFTNAYYASDVYGVIVRTEPARQQNDAEMEM